MSVYLPVPLLACQPSFQSGIHSQIGGRECTLRVGGLSLPVEDSAASLKLIRCPTQAKGSYLVLTNICLLPTAVRLDSRYAMSCLSHLPECVLSGQLRVSPLSFFFMKYVLWINQNYRCPRNGVISSWVVWASHNWASSFGLVPLSVGVLWNYVCELKKL